jgi:hypothetical protein
MDFTETYLPYGINTPGNVRNIPAARRAHQAVYTFIGHRALGMIWNPAAGVNKENRL